MSCIFPSTFPVNTVGLLPIRTYNCNCNLLVLHVGCRIMGNSTCGDIPHAFMDKNSQLIHLLSFPLIKMTAGASFTVPQGHLWVSNRHGNQLINAPCMSFFPFPVSFPYFPTEAPSAHLPKTVYSAPWLWFCFQDTPIGQLLSFCYHTSWEQWRNVSPDF